ncbi:DNA polymerase IV [Clostridium botulinum C/D str. BKT12695]|nr:DNA polymerase IV [Clostridium botulinum C/D str. BKT12695]
MDRVILHVDMDAFFASVEVMDKPSLKGKPVVVGGISERGVVSTCSYEARKYGIRSAMPVYKAKALCPSAVFLPTRHYRYKEISRKVFEILSKVTNKIEQVSIDEAYLDITNINMNPKDLAVNIKNMIKENMGLTISVGISYNKFLAKLASDWNKPDGLKIITKDMIPDILMPLSINKVHGIGRKSAKKLNNIGIFTVKQLYTLPKKLFYEYFGKFGLDIYNRIRGIDNREVITVREQKSIGKETTLKKDTKDKDELKKFLWIFAINIEEKLTASNVKGKTITLKIKTASFENHTRSKSLDKYISSRQEIYKVACAILDSIEFSEKIRLIGTSISSLKDVEVEQLTLF